jgi:copper resistance protein B
MRLVAILGATLVVSIPVVAQGQSMPGMSMPGMDMAPSPKPKKKAAAVVVAKKAPIAKPGDSTPGIDMPGMNMMAGAPPPAAVAPSSMQGMAMQGMDMNGMTMSNNPAVASGSAVVTGTALPAGNAPAPAPPTDHYASKFFPADQINRAHQLMMREQGGQNFDQVLFNLAEYQVRRGGNGYRWDGEAWFGGDINRLALKTEGEGAVRGGIDTAEIQALYSRLVGPYFSLQTGVRHDLQPSPTRTYATVGFEGLAPYMFEVGGALFLSDKGGLLGRLEGYYDERITQRLILQPRVELNFSAQNVPENRIGSGLSNAELGLRLRYEIRREFAPYVGVSWDRKLGDTARFYRTAGERGSSPSLVAGIRFWF